MKRGKIDTQEACRRLKMPRTTFIYRRDVIGVKPRIEVVAGRARNFYTLADLRAIAALRKN